MANESARDLRPRNERAGHRPFDRLTRRRLLGLLGAGTATAVLAACGGDSPTATSAPAATVAATGAAAQPTAATGATTAAAAAQPPAAAQAGGKRGGVFNGAYPYELPPA